MKLFEEMVKLRRTPFRVDNCLVLDKMASEIGADASDTAGNLEEASSLERRSLEAVAEVDMTAAVAALMFALCFRFSGSLHLPALLNNYGEAGEL
jgi:hypothetical protein